MVWVSTCSFTRRRPSRAASTPHETHEPPSIETTHAVCQNSNSQGRVIADVIFVVIADLAFVRTAYDINFSLEVNGILLLGAAETLGDVEDEFKVLQEKFKLFFFSRRG